MRGTKYRDLEISGNAGIYRIVSNSHGNTTGYLYVTYVASN